MSVEAQLEQADTALTAKQKRLLNIDRTQFSVVVGVLSFLGGLATGWFTSKKYYGGKKY